jgi:acyl-CoA thioesterase
VTAFDRATAVRRLNAGRPARFAVDVDTAWSAPVGPNGGYVAALVLRAMLEAMDRPERAPRSLTLHYLRTLAEGPAVVEVVEERAGRGLSTLSARVVQGDRLCVLALAACAVDYPSEAEYATRPPACPPASAVAVLPAHPQAPPIVHRFEMRPAFGAAPFSGSGEAVTGGWLRLAEPRAPDVLALAAYTDAWWPAPWVRLRALSPAPTIDLTIHFRARPPADPDTPLLVRFGSSTSRDGFVEEDAQVWAPDGTLLAQARQLALLVPAKAA